MEIAPLRQTNTVIRQRGDFLTEKEKERNLLWQLFVDTGDPLCWVLYRRRSVPGEGRTRRPF